MFAEGREHSKKDGMGSTVFEILMILCLASHYQLREMIHSFLKRPRQVERLSYFLCPWDGVANIRRGKPAQR